MKGAVVAALSVLTACGSHAYSGQGCTEIGSPTGIRLEIQPPFAAKVTDASMKVCHDGACRTSVVRLDPSTTTRPEGCTGGDAGDVCAGSAVPTGGRHGFTDVPALAEKPVRVTVVLRDASGARLLDRGLTVTPKAVYANGPRCGRTGRQASVVVANGRLREGG